MKARFEEWPHEGWTDVIGDGFAGEVAGDKVGAVGHGARMRWVLMLFVMLAAVMGGEARAVVVMGPVEVSRRVGRAEMVEMVEKRAEALRVESERAFLEVEEVAGLVDAGPLALWFPGGLAVARSDCGERQAEFSGGTLSLLLARGVDIGGGTRGLLWTARRETGSAETGSAVTLRFNRYNSRGDVVGQSDAAGVTTWAATYQADGRRTGEIGTNLNPKQATGRVRELGVNRDRHRANSKEEDPTGLLNEGFRYRDMETGTFISRDPLGHVDGPNVYCYVGQNPWTKWDPRGLTPDEMEIDQDDDDYVNVYYRDNPRMGWWKSDSREKVGTMMEDGWVDLGNGRKTSMAAIREQIDGSGTDFSEFKTSKSLTLPIDGELDGVGAILTGASARNAAGEYGPADFDSDRKLLSVAKSLAEVAVAQYIPMLGVAPAVTRELQFANAVRVMASAEKIARADGIAAIKDLRSLHGIGAGRNVAYAEGAIDGAELGQVVGVSGAHTPGVKAGAARLFETKVVQHTRELDSEAHILEHIGSGLTAESTGTIRLFSERAPCESCRGVVTQFRKMFPQVRVIVSHGDHG